MRMYIICSNGSMQYVRFLIDYVMISILLLKLEDVC